MHGVCFLTVREKPFFRPGAAEFSSCGLHFKTVGKMLQELLDLGRHKTGIPEKMKPPSKGLGEGFDPLSRRDSAR